MRVVNVVAYRSVAPVDDETLIRWPDGFRIGRDDVDSPFASWPGDEEPTGYIDADRLGVYHPPFQELASQRTTSAGRSTMGTTTDDSTTQDEQTKTDGQNTGAQAGESTEQSNTTADPAPAADEGEGDETGEGSTGTEGGVPETDGATAG